MKKDELIQALKGWLDGKNRLFRVS
jgi:hypothetical protein